MVSNKIISLLTLCLFALNSTSQTKNEDISTWINHKGEFFSIQYPPDWNLNISGNYGTTFVIYSPLESLKDEFTSNVNLLVQDLSSYNLTLEEYSKISVDQINTYFTNVTIIDSRVIKGSKRSYYSVLYEGNSGVRDLRFLQYYWVIDKKAYVLTFTCEQNKPVSISTLGERILSTFELNL